MPETDIRNLTTSIVLLAPAAIWRSGVDFDPIIPCNSQYRGHVLK